MKSPTLYENSIGDPGPLIDPENDCWHQRGKLLLVHIGVDGYEYKQLNLLHPVLRVVMNPEGKQAFRVWVALQILAVSGGYGEHDARWFNPLMEDCHISIAEGILLDKNKERFLRQVADVKDMISKAWRHTPGRDGNIWVMFRVMARYNFENSRLKGDDPRILFDLHAGMAPCQKNDEYYTHAHFLHTLEQKLSCHLDVGTRHRGLTGQLVFHLSVYLKRSYDAIHIHETLAANAKLARDFISKLRTKDQGIWDNRSDDRVWKVPPVVLP